ncbi:MAG TPA: heavy metal-associated domain-containing protein [Kofleriaceae bacterium]|jgi:copper chaperone CopZ|nr:heavy metal-associated domain-containing protein [Kofleriaceae bacterium]
MSSPQSFSFAIDGMHCQACVRRVRAAVEKVPGVTVDDVSIGAVTGTVAEPATLGEVAAAIGKAGYTATPRG